MVSPPRQAIALHRRRPVARFAVPYIDPEWISPPKESNVMTEIAADGSTVRLRNARPAADPRQVVVRYGQSDTTATWQEAKTVLVSWVAGAQRLATAPRLVIPVGETQLAFRISSDSSEAERLEGDDRVLVQPGDWRGKPTLGSHQRQGRAQVVTGGTLLAHVQSEIDAKYRWRIPLARFAHRMARGAGRYGDVVVLITVHEPSPIPLPP